MPETRRFQEGGFDIAYQVISVHNAPPLLAVLPALAPYGEEPSPWKTLNHVRQIAVANVVSFVWNPGRMNRCLRRLLIDGTKPPHIDVTRFILNGRPYYIPGDGNHRTEAKKAAGQPRIKAEISAEITLEPANFILDKLGSLWEKDFTRPGAWKFIGRFERPDVIAAFEEAGVRRINERW